MLNNGKIRIQKPIHAVLRTALLVLLKLAAADGASDAFAPADIGQVVYRCSISALSSDKFARGQVWTELEMERRRKPGVKQGEQGRSGGGD